MKQPSASRRRAKASVHIENLSVEVNTKKTPPGRVATNSCVVHVIGVAMDCPVCHTHVPAGTRHECRNGKPVIEIEGEL